MISGGCPFIFTTSVNANKCELQELFTTVVVPRYIQLLIQTSVQNETNANATARATCQCEQYRIPKPRVYNNDNKHVGHHRMRRLHVHLIIRARPHPGGHNWQLTTGAHSPIIQFKTKERNIRNNETGLRLPGESMSATVPTLRAAVAATTSTTTSKQKFTRQARSCFLSTYSGSSRAL